MKPRTATHLVLATLAFLWIAAVVSSLRYRDLSWVRVFFVDVTWLQAILLIAGGYGALILLVGALARIPHPKMLRKRPFVSIVVPAKNEEAVIEATLRSLGAQRYHKDEQRCFELIIVDDRSTDGTPRILERLSRELSLKVVRTPDGSRGKAAALNFGIARARGDFIAVFDADARIGPDFLERMVGGLDAERVGGAQGQRRLYNAHQNWLTRIQEDEYCLFQHLLQRARMVLGGMVCFAGNGLLLRREALDDVGGWNEDALTEDVDLTVRFHLAGWHIRYVEDAVVWEEAIPGMNDLLRQRVRWFEGALRCLGDWLPTIFFGRASLFKRIDMLFFLGGALVVTLGLLTSYLYAVIDVLGAVMLYVQLPRWQTAWSSVVFSTAFALTMLIHSRGGVLEAALFIARSILFSVHRLLVVPIAIQRYVRSAFTGEVSWEKTAHGASGSAGAWSGRPLDVARGIRLGTSEGHERASEAGESNG